MQPVQVGKITVSRVEEMMWTISPRFLFPDLTYQDFADSPGFRGKISRH